MRLFGIFIVGFSVMLIGFHFVNKYIERTNQLKSILYMISMIKQKIEYKKLTVNEILKQIYIIDELNFLDINSFNINDICFKNNQLKIKIQEKNSLFNFLNELGKTDLSRQLKHCDMYIKFFEEYINKSKEENQTKIKLFPTLFILSGLLIIILLL